MSEGGQTQAATGPEETEPFKTQAPGQPGQADEPWQTLEGPAHQSWQAQIAAFRTRLWEEALRVEVDINGREKGRPTELTSSMIKDAYKECTSLSRRTQSTRRIWRVVLTLVGGLSGIFAGVFSNHIDNSWGVAGPIGLAICAALFAASMILSAVISGDAP